MAYSETNYAWLIDKDLCSDVEDGEENLAGFCGPTNLNIDFLLEMRNNIFAGERFRIRYTQNDPEIAFTGRLMAKNGKVLSEKVREPLDEFASDIAGCEIIEYRMKGTWRAF